MNRYILIKIKALLFDPTERVSATGIVKAADLVTDLRTFGEPFRVSSGSFAEFQRYTNYDLEVMVRRYNKCPCEVRINLIPAKNQPDNQYDDIIPVFAWQNDTVERFNRGSWVLTLMSAAKLAITMIKHAEQTEYRKRFERID